MNQLTDFLAMRQGRSLAEQATAGLGSARPPHVSRRGNRFTLVDSAGNERNATFMDQATGQMFMDMIVVDVNPAKSKLYYGGRTYNEDDSTPPICWSDNGTGPSTQATVPQAPTCAVCPNNEWGSDVSRVTGAPIRACRDQKKLAVVVPSDDTGMVYEFVVPPASFSDKEHGWVRYVNSIKGYMIGTRKADVCDIVTRVYFLPGQMGVLGFQPSPAFGLVEGDENLVTRVMNAWKDDFAACKAVTGVLDKARDPNAPVAPRPAAVAAPVSQPPSLPVPPAPLPQAPLASPAALAQPTPEQAPRKRGPKPKAAMPAAGGQFPVGNVPMSSLTAPAAAQGEEEVIPPFLKRTPTPTQAPMPQQVAGVATNPPAPPNDIQAALDAAFKLNVPGA